MISISLLLVFIHVILAVNVLGQSIIPVAEQQLRTAVSPAPADMQEAAALLGYNVQGELNLLREGSNDLICLADDPNEDRFHAACYHRDLEHL